MSNSTGHVYLLKNKSMKGFYKIGHTTNTPQVRADELSRATGVPMNFEVLASFEVNRFTSSLNVEQSIHNVLKNSRVGNKEFFRLRNDKEAKAIFVMSALDSMNRMLESEEGGEWIHNNITAPLQDAEHALMDKLFKENSSSEISKISSLLQGHLIASMRLQDLSIFMSIDYALESVSAGGLVFHRLGFCHSELAGCEYYLEKSSFLSDWLCRQFSLIIRDHEDKTIKENN